MACQQATKQPHVRYSTNNYQLSLTDPCDKIGLQTELDDLHDKLQWSSVIGIINLVDRRRSSLSRSEHRHLSRAKLIARLTTDMP